jgi:hypothetical protein
MLLDRRNGGAFGPRSARIRPRSAGASISPAIPAARSRASTWRKCTSSRSRAASIRSST